MGLVGILLGLALLMWLAYRGWSVLLAAPAAALLAAAISGEPLLAHWTQTFMGGASRFVMQWFPMFLLGGLFGKLMEDSRSISAIARSLTERLGTKRTMLSVVLASAVVTYGGVSVFVAFFVLVPMAQEMFRTANLPRRLMPAAIGLGAFTFTMSAMPGTPSVNNAIPMPYFGTTAFAAPGLGIIASAIIMLLGMWWLRRAEAAARLAGEGFVAPAARATRGCEPGDRRDDARPCDGGGRLRSGRTRTRQARDQRADVLLRRAAPGRGHRRELPDVARRAAAPRLLVPGGGSLGRNHHPGRGRHLVGGAGARGGLPDRRHRQLAAPAGPAGDPGRRRQRVGPAAADGGSLVGFGAVVGALPAFATVRDAVLSIEGGPLVSLTIAMNALAGLTGTASGGMAIALNALGATYMALAAEYDINPELMHRITTISAGTLDALPHNGTVLILLKLCGLTHRESYLDMVMTVIVTCIIALVAVLILGSMFGSF